MHDSTPIPPDPESERRGHELRDVAIRPILYFLIGLFVFGGVLQTVMSALMSGYVVPDSQVGAPVLSIEEARLDQLRDLNLLRDEGQLDHVGALQRDTTGDMLRMYAEEDAVLKGYGFDKKTNRYHIPIERAMKLVVEKKMLKVRPDPGTEPKDLPYPMRSLPYRATY